MALGGDPPTDPDAAAGELDPRLRAGGAGPGHRRVLHRGGRPARRATRSRPTWRADRDHLAAKLALADFAVTQFFFEADEYTSLVADLAERGVTKPVLPGIMPVEQPQLGARGWPAWARPCPAWMVERLEAADARGGAEAVRHEGVACATELCEQLLAAGVPGPALLHAQPVERDPRDLLRPRPGHGLSPGRGRPAGRRAERTFSVAGSPSGARAAG